MDSMDYSPEAGKCAPLGAEWRMTLVDDRDLALDLVEAFIQHWSKQAAVPRMQKRAAARNRVLSTAKHSTIYNIS